MKYLKKYKLFESVNEQEIHEICKKYGIRNYTINSDLSIDVEGNVNLSSEGLTKLPLKFRNVSGYFYCYNNNLMSLEGAPSKVDDGFFCNHNELTSLEGAPSQVDGNFYCYNNNLMSLEGAPSRVDGGFSCSSNNLTSLEGAPTSVGGGFSCSHNDLTSLLGAPSRVGGGFSCSYNKLTSLIGFEWKYFERIDLEKNPVYLIVKDWINNEDRVDLIEYFIDMNVLQDQEVGKSKLIIPRLEAFHEEMNLELKINFEEVKKYYEIIE